MARERTELQQALLAIAPKAWFKRPPDNRMTYPCFIYRPSRPRVIRADNKAYTYYPCYNVIYISQNPDDGITRRMLETFEYCDTDREYEADGLYHYSFTLYW